MSDRPQRIQRRRTLGWRLPENASIVDRTSRYGNPFTVWECLEAEMASDEADARRVCAEQFERWLGGEAECGPPGTRSSALVRQWILDNLHELEGRDLACPCPPPADGQPDHCHGVHLLRRANP